MTFHRNSEYIRGNEMVINFDIDFKVHFLLFLSPIQKRFVYKNYLLLDKYIYTEYKHKQSVESPQQYLQKI